MESEYSLFLLSMSPGIILSRLTPHFFHVKDGEIVFQRGYWDKLSFLKLQGTEFHYVPEENG